MRSTSSWAHGRAFWFLLCLFLYAMPGCGSGPYPEPTVRNAEGNPGKCAQCGKDIPLVGEQNMITVGSTRFVICNQQCGAKLTDKMKNQ